MGALVNLFVIGLVGIAVLSGWFAAPASAAEEGEPESASEAESASEEGARAGDHRWVPSLAIISGVTFQQQSATVVSSDSFGNPIGGRCPQDVRLMPGITTAADCLVDGTQWAVSPYVGANLEILTPTLSLPGRPRIFLNGAVLPSFAPDREIALEGDPGEFEVPSTIRYPDTAVLGQGSSTTATLDTWVFAAAIGVAFPFEFKGRRLWAKPSVGWIRYKMDVQGLVRDVQCAPFPPPPAQVTTQCEDLPNQNFTGFRRDVSLSASDSQWYDGVGPGFELEMMVGRFGPIGSSLFIDAHAYRILGDRSVFLSDSASFDDVLGTDDYNAAWSFEVDPWMLRAGAGVRFQWLGFDK
jgi:hypothetical protein